MAADRKRRYWPPPWWRFKDRKSRAIKRVRARDGDDCWLCARPMRFGAAPPNCGKAATIEHVVSLSKGGSCKLDNLRLCHPGCNRHLADKTPEQKERMRSAQARDQAIQPLTPPSGLRAPHTRAARG